MGGDVVDHEAPPARVIECVSHQYVDLEDRLGESAPPPRLPEDNRSV